MDTWILMVSILAFTTLNGFSCHRYRSMKVLTFNTGLTNFIFPDDPFADIRVKRRDRLIDTLNHIKFDLVCLQEVWSADDVAAIVHGVSKKFKYSFSKLHTGTRAEDFQRSTGGSVCTGNEINAILECVEDSCSSTVIPEQFFVCASTCIAMVQETETSLDEDCITCVLTSLPFFNLASGCGGRDGFQTVREINTNGLLLLSKKELSNTRSEDFFPSTLELEVHGYLFANVHGVQTVCTQLTSDTLAEYGEVFLQEAFGFQSYSEQNAFEANILKTRLRDSEKLLLLGDFASGPASTSGVMAKYENNYNILAAEFNTMALSQCTICSQDENPYNSEETNFTVDHVFTKGLCIQKVKRLFTQRDVSILFKLQMLPLSDHFGVGAKILPAHACQRPNSRG